MTSTTDFAISHKAFVRPPDGSSKVKSYDRMVDDNIHTVAELLAQAEKAGTTMSHHENALTVLKVMLWAEARGDRRHHQVAGYII